MWMGGGFKTRAGGKYAERDDLANNKAQNLTLELCTRSEGVWGKRVVPQNGGFGGSPPKVRIPQTQFNITIPNTPKHA